MFSVLFRFERLRSRGSFLHVICADCIGRFGVVLWSFREPVFKFRMWYIGRSLWLGVLRDGSLGEKQSCESSDGTFAHIHCGICPNYAALRPDYSGGAGLSLARSFRQSSAHTQAVLRPEHFPAKPCLQVLNRALARHWRICGQCSRLQHCDVTRRTYRTCSFSDYMHVCENSLDVLFQVHMYSP